ncbi:nuclear transport factor 2 family protein [Pseudaestuariivita sp.]|uniref:nuclear transport factor 2 family protein n=1 Tax=Pseudaestuariivita sp. TaxID=2211669 RepID=UPI0040581538
MRDAITEFFDAWAMADETPRRAAVEAATAQDVSYADPRTPEPITGQDALTDYVGMFSANAPGWTARVLASDEVAGLTRATIAFGGKGPDGTEMVQHGQYFIEQSDGRITRMTGFAGTGSPD